MALAKHPFEGVGKQFILLGFALAVLSLFGLLQHLPALASLGAMGAVYFAYVGRSMIRSGRAIVLINLSLDHVTRGQTKEAEGYLAQIDPTAIAKGALGRAVRIQRALIALHRGDLELADTEAASVIALPRGLVGREQQRFADANAHATRAIALAALGKNDEAERQAAAAETSDMATPEALARARLARAITIARTEGGAGLAPFFARGGASMIEHLSPRERGLARALRRMARTSARHPYREPPPKETNEEASWMAKLVPDAAPFAADVRRATTPLDTHVEVTEEGRVLAGKALATTRDRASIGRKVAAGVSLITILTTSVILFKNAVAPGRPHTGYRLPVTDTVALFLVYAAVPALGLLVLLFAYSARKNRAIARAFIGARRDLARRDDAKVEQEMRPMTKSPHAMLASGAWLLLAQGAEQRADFAACLDACDRGQARLTGGGMQRIYSSDFTLPELVATRALSLAHLGRRAESDVERARLATEFPSFPFTGRAHLRIALANAVHAGDLEAAAKVAHSRSLDMPLPLRDDLLVDVVLAVTDGAPSDEIERIGGELGDDETTRRWIDAVAPGLRDKMHARSDA